MNIITGLKNLLFNPKEFFENAPKGMLIPFIVTLVYGIVSLFASLPILFKTMEMLPSELQGMEGIIIGTTVVTTLITVFVTWIVVSLLFFACVKIIGYAKCSFKDMLRVISYPAVILTIQVILTALISLIGTPASIVTLILSGVFLFWTIPVWVFGIQSITGMETKAVFKCIAAPIILMIVVSIVSFVMTMNATVPAI